MAVYSNWNSSTSFHDKNWDSCKVILHNCWDDDELEVVKPCPEYFEGDLRGKPLKWELAFRALVLAWNSYARQACGQAWSQASASVSTTFWFFWRAPKPCLRQNRFGLPMTTLKCFGHPTNNFPVAVIWSRLRVASRQKVMKMTTRNDFLVRVERKCFQFSAKFINC